MSVKAVNEMHIREMQHCIGLDYEKPKRGKYEAYRNYCYCSVPDTTWDYLVKIGYAKCYVEEKKDSVPNKSYTYYLTQDGLDFIGIITGCTITLRS